MAYFIDGIQYDEAEYQEIRKIINSRPADTFETVHRFNHEKKMIEGYERTEEEKVDWFVEAVELGTITIDKVPNEYKEAVEARIQPKEEISEYQQGYDDAVLAMIEAGLL